MATPKCPKCENTRFEMQEIDIEKSNYRMNVINCSSCGTIVDSHEYLNIGAELKALAKKLNV